MKPDSNQKILYVITKSNFGGAQKYVYEMAVAAKQAGYEIAVAGGGTGQAGAAPGQLVTKLQAESIPFHFIQHFMRNVSVWSDAQAFFEIISLLRRERPQVLHVTSSKAGALGALAGRCCGVPRIIFTSHGLTMDETWRPRWQRVIISLSTWVTLQLAHHSIMISTDTYRRASRLPFLKGRVHLIFNGVRQIDLKDKAVAMTSLISEAATDEIWIGGVGELHPNKNWALVIKAFAQAAIPDSRLVIIGEGEQMEELSSLAKSLNCSAAVNFVTQNPSAQFFKAFDIFVLASVKEGLPYVLLEAGLAKCAVVCSDIPGNRDIITDQENGELVPLSVEAFAETFHKLAEDRELCLRYGATLQETVTTTFRMEKMILDTLALYR